MKTKHEAFTLDNARRAIATLRIVELLKLYPVAYAEELIRCMSERVDALDADDDGPGPLRLVR
jgi:hypothetical protein